MDLDLISKDGRKMFTRVNTSPITDENGDHIGTLAYVTDLTARKASEEALKKNQMLLTNTQKAAKLGSFEYDIVDESVRWSEESYRIFERDPLFGAISLMEMRSYYHPDDKAKVVERMRIALEKGEASELEYRIVLPGGHIKHIQGRMIPEKDDKGKVIRLLGTVLDVTERRMVEEAMLESERKFRYFVQQSSEGISFIDEDGRILEWNHRLEQITGLEREKAIGRFTWDVRSPLMNRDGGERYTPEQTKEAITKALGSGTAPFLGSPIEAHYTRPDGGIRTVQQLSFPIRTERGHMIGTTVLDITERKAAEEALASEVKINKMIADLSSGILTKDAIDDIAVTMFAGLKELTGSGSGFVGYLEPRTGYLIVPTLAPDHGSAEQRNVTVIKELKGAWGKVVSGRTPMFTNDPKNEVAAIWASGTDTVVKRYLSVPAMIGDTFVGFIGLANSPRDYTEKDLELVQRLATIFAIALLRKKMDESLMGSNDVLRLITKIMRHDIQNDLTVISASLELHKMTGSDDYLERATRSINKITELIGRMKELEMFFTGVSGSLRPYDLRAEIDLVMRDYAPLLYSIRGNGLVMADQAVTSVIDNLVRNAIRHGQTKRIDFSIEDHGELCQLRVADLGVGISDKIKGKVFEEGFCYGPQAGSGLGLYLIRKTIERYGGTVHIEDNQPKGAVFVLDIPQKRPSTDDGRQSG